MPNPTDHEQRAVLAGLRQGDRRASVELVDRLTPLINRMVFRLTGWHPETQDLVQEVFLAIQQSADTFRGDCRLETWVTSITINCCRRWQRQQSRMEPTGDSPPEPIDETDEQCRHTDEAKEEVQVALQRIQHDQRELLVLRYLEGHSLEDLAELLQVRKNTLEVRLHRARQALARRLRARDLETRNHYE
jgi:RNA polymerase sigma-70 factor (ECF subfamily)